MPDSRDAARDIDPDLFDVVVQSLSLLSSIATLAVAWKTLSLKPGRLLQEDDLRDTAMRGSLRSLRRSLEDAFESVEHIIRVVDKSQASILEAEPRFGAGILLDEADFNIVLGHLHALNAAAQQARMFALTIQTTIIQRGSSLEKRIDFAVIVSLNADLNDILFQTKTIREALTKLRAARDKAENFISELERLLQGN